MTRLEELQRSLEYVHAQHEGRKQLIGRMLSNIMEVAHAMGVVPTLQKVTDPKTGRYSLQGMCDMARTEYSHVLELERMIQIEQSREDTENDHS